MANNEWRYPAGHVQVTRKAGADVSLGVSLAGDRLTSPQSRLKAALTYSFPEGDGTCRGCPWGRGIHMSAYHVMAMPPVAGSTRPGPALPARQAPAGAGEPRGGWWRAWRDRFGLAEACGTLTAVIGFAVGYLGAGSLLAAAGLATLCEAIGFYGCVGARTGADARRATAHLAGFRRLAAGAWHAVTQQLASCAAAEVLDSLVIRPGCVASGAWLARSLPGGVWLGFAIGKAAADLAWYGMEAAARRGVARSLAVRLPGPGAVLTRLGDGEGGAR